MACSDASVSMSSGWSNTGDEREDSLSLCFKVSMAFLQRSGKFLLLVNSSLESVRIRVYSELFGIHFA